MVTADPNVARLPEASSRSTFAGWQEFLAKEPGLVPSKPIWLAVRALMANPVLVAEISPAALANNWYPPAALLIERLLKDRKGNSDKLLARVKKAKSDRGFRKLLEIAGGILPVYLKPQGQNPLVHLYRLASEGLHNLPEEECIDIFDESIMVFSFVFSALRRHQNEVKA